MTTDVPSCEEFEIAALRRARGALDVDAVARLDAHLADCAACRGFAATAQATQSALVRRAIEAAEQPSRRADAARRSLGRHLTDGRRRLIRVGVVLVLIVALRAWSQGWESAAFVGAMGALVAAFGVAAVLLPRRRRLRAAAAVDGELLTHLRAELDREIGGLRKARPMFSVLAIAAAALAVLTAVHAVEDAWIVPREAGVGRYVAPLVVAGLLVVRLWHDVTRRLPRLERERRELS